MQFTILGFILIIYGHRIYSMNVVKTHLQLTEIPVWDIDKDVTNLDISHNSLTSVDDHMFLNHTNLQTIHLSYNKITYISSDAFQGILNLQKLYFRKNQLTDFPDLGLVSNSLKTLCLMENGITSTIMSSILMQKLTSLDLRHNQISILSPTMFRYITPGLTTLKLDNNKISSITGGFFSSFTSITTLQLSSNKLTQFDAAELNVSKTLQILNLHYNQIYQLECNSLAGVLNLKTLNLNYNSLQNFSVKELTGDQNMSKLLNLHLHQNQLKAPPATNLLPRSMSALDIGGNEMGSIPDGYYDVYTSATHLNLPNVGLTEIPVFTTTAMQNLEILTLNQNKLSAFRITRDIVNQIPNLKKLYLANNKLTSLNESGNCAQNITLANLEILHLYSNLISYIYENYFCQTPKLKTLRLHQNRLTSLIISSNLNFLTEIHLNNNGMQQFPGLGSTVTTLQRLYLQSNELRNITLPNIDGNLSTAKTTSLQLLYLNNNYGIYVADDVFESMPSLQTLNMRYTTLQVFPNLSAFTELRTLDLQGNKITEIGGQDLAYIKQNTRLYYINLSHNRLYTIGNLQEIAEFIISTSLKIKLNGNSFQCDVNMCWIRNMTLQ